MLEYLLFLVGFVLLITGANYLIKGASFLAKKLNVSPLIIGLTIVAFGTSLPELVTSITAGIKKKADLAVGNIIGSNVANFSIAVTKYKDKKTGKWIADYFDCVAWRDLAVNIFKSIKKGTRVILSGKIENQNWEDSDGMKRKNTRVFTLLLFGI